MFFSISDINVVELAVKKNPFHSSGHWVKRFYPDQLQWSWDDSMEFFLDFHKYNSLKIEIVNEVCKIIHNKCDGYVHFLPTFLHLTNSFSVIVITSHTLHMAFKSIAKTMRSEYLMKIIG